MPIEFFTLNVDVSQIVGTPVKRARIRVTTNLPDGTPIAYGSQSRIFVPGGIYEMPGGVGSVELPTKTGATNVSDWQYVFTIEAQLDGVKPPLIDPIHVDAPTSTAADNLVNFVGVTSVPATFMGAAVAQITAAGQTSLASTVAARDAAQSATQAAQAAATVAGERRDQAAASAASATAVALGDAADVLASAIVNDGPVKDNLTATVATGIADSVPPMIAAQLADASPAIAAAAADFAASGQGVLTAGAAPTLASNLIPDPQAKTSGGSTSTAGAFDATRITTGLPPGIAHGLETTRGGTLSTVISQPFIGAMSNTDPLRIPVTPGAVRSFLASVWTDQSGAQARLDVRWYSAADALLSTSTGSYLPLPASTWGIRSLVAQTVPVSAAYAVLVPTISTTGGAQTVAGAKARVTAGMMVEGSTAPTYADGSFATQGWAWTSAAHASVSKKVLLTAGEFASPASVTASAMTAAEAAVAFAGRPVVVKNPIPGWTLPVTITKTPMGYGAVIDHEAIHVRGVGPTLYVDPVNGNNANDGLTWATAKKDPGNAASAGGTYTPAEIVIDGGIYTRAESIGTAIGRPDLIIRAKPGTRPVFTQCDRSTAWAAYSGGPAHSVSLSSNGIVFDLAAGAPRTSTGLPVPLTKVADAAAVVATPHSCAVVGSTIYVHTYNSRVPDTNVLVSRMTYHLNTTTIALPDPHRLLIDGIEFWGGEYARVKAFHAGATFVTKDCAWRFAAGNGLAVQGFSKVVGVNPVATHNGIDGFNYHDDAGLSGEVLEVNVVGRLNGQAPGASSCNGSTAHETYKILRVGGVLEFNPGPNLADVNDVLSANFGVDLGDAIGYGGVDDYDIAAPEGSNGRMWLIDCTSRSTLALRNGAKAEVQNFKRVGTIDGGTPTPYA